MFKNHLIGVIAMLFVMVALSYGAISQYSPQYRNAAEEQEKHNKNIENTSQKIAPSGKELVDTNNTNCQNCEPKKNWWRRFITDPVATFTGLLFIATLLLWRATSELVRGADETSRKQLRAYVFATGYWQYWEQDPVTGFYNWRFRPILRNSGSTPTKHMTMYVECILRNTELPIGFNFTEQVTNIGGGLMPPHADLQGGITPPPPQAAITPQDILDAQYGRKYIYLWGWIKYFDVFPNTRMHITRYCWLLNISGDPFNYIPNTLGQPPTSGTLAFNSIHHREGNCADNECG